MAEGTSKWRDIEPILKWGAVSYACGFLIVMIHTARLGIPALQLIEPINIWIGLPVTIVLFFFDKLINKWKRAMEELDRELTEAVALAVKIGKEKDPDQVYDLIVNTIVRAFSSTFVFPSVNPSEFLMKKIFGYYRTKFTAALTETLPERKRLVAQGWLWRVLSVAAFFAAVQRFVNVIVELAVMLIACSLYVGVLYSRIPQTYGGGRPMDVQVIIDAESIPQESSYFRDVLPPQSKSTGQTQSKSTGQTENNSANQTEDKSTRQKTKTTTTIAAVLYYQTEDAYYVRIKKEQTPVGPIVSISNHTVEGIVFAK